MFSPTKTCVYACQIDRQTVGFKFGRIIPKAKTLVPSFQRIHNHSSMTFATVLLQSSNQ